MLYICKRKVKVYSIYNARKKEKPALLLFSFPWPAILPPNPLFRLFVSFIFVNCYQQFTPLLVAITFIARGNWSNCSWLRRKSSLSFQKTSRTFLNSSLCFLKSWAGILKSWPTILKSPPAIPKRQWLFPKTQAVLPAFPAMVNNA